jgi:RsmE family RNA methyltransferase
VLIGPEGGWSERERDMIPDVVDLGPTVLRAETAAVVASTFLVTSRVRSD